MVSSENSMSLRIEDVLNVKRRRNFMCLIEAWNWHSTRILEMDYRFLNLRVECVYEWSYESGMSFLDCLVSCNSNSHRRGMSCSIFMVKHFSEQISVPTFLAKSACVVLTQMRSLHIKHIHMFSRRACSDPDAHLKLSCRFSNLFWLIEASVKDVQEHFSIRILVYTLQHRK